MTYPGPTLRSPVCELIGGLLTAAPSYRRRLLAVSALIALLVLTTLLAADFSRSATAQTSVALVGNNLKADVNGVFGFNKDRAQAFTTGSNSAGYKLTSVQIGVQIGATSVTSYNVKVMSEGTSGPGSTKVGDLNNPTNLTAGISNSFSASGGGLDLKPNTTYYILMDLSASHNTVVLKATKDDGENPNRAAGWGIANKSLSRNPGSSGAWTSLNNKWKIIINGYAKTRPVLKRAAINGGTLVLDYDKALDTASGTAPRKFWIKVDGSTARQHALKLSISGTQVKLKVPTVKRGQAVTLWYAKPARNPLKDDDNTEAVAIHRRIVTNDTGASRLVSNIRQAQGTASPVQLGADYAQEFSTGSHAYGYKLTRVDMRMSDNSNSPPNYSVSIHEDSTGAPGRRLATLTNPTFLPSTARLVQFTASGGIDLAHRSTYWVVIDIPNIESAVTIAATSSDSEDSIGLATWSIANKRRARLYGATQWGIVTQTNALKIAINGYAKPDTTPPTVQTTDVEDSGKMMTVQLSEANLKGGVAATDWSYSVDGVKIDPAAKAIGWYPSMGKITFTLAQTVKQNQVVKLRYTKGTTNPIRDQADNALPSFSRQVAPKLQHQSLQRLRSTALSADPANLARGPLLSNDEVGPHALPTSISEISGNKPSGASGSLDVSEIAASVRQELRQHSRGTYLTTQVFGLDEQSSLVRHSPAGGTYMTTASGERYELVGGTALLHVKLWHVYHHNGRGSNSIERLGGPWNSRRDNKLVEPVEVCLPMPDEGGAIAVRINGQSAWTVLETVERSGQICAEPVLIGWFAVVHSSDVQGE
ncbi:MAG: SwmB domain-containing protein [Chloroflexi bacterium]|nr:SwmB domain-containing protein [Chloroflexota bacterium]